ncbi:MAG: hypothetical protein ACKOWX_01620 [Flavobacteriales bacterium]
MKHLIRLGIALQLVFLLFLVKAVWFSSAQFTLKSPSLTYIKTVGISATNKAAADTLAPQLKTKADSIAQKKANFERLFPHTPNDTVKRVLLIGDSQLENIRNPIRKRLMDNNYQLVGSIIWYGSSTKQWANSDTLAYYIAKYKPDFVLIALGLNELFVNDLDKRTAYAGQIKHKLEVAHMPYYFIGPAAWVKDKGITGVLQQTFGELFYPSHLLTLERAADGRHPSKYGGVKWIEQVARQMSSKGILNLSAVKDTSYAGSSPTILLKVPKE